MSCWGSVPDNNEVRKLVFLPFLPSTSLSRSLLPQMKCDIPKILIQFMRILCKPLKPQCGVEWVNAK